MFQTVIAMASRLTAIEKAVANLVAANVGQQQQQLVHAGSFTTTADSASLAANGRAAQLRHLPSNLTLAPQMSSGVASAGMALAPTGATSAGYAPAQSRGYGNQLHAFAPHSLSRPLHATISGAVPSMMPQHSGMIPSVPSQIIPGMAGLPPPIPAQITTGSTGSAADAMAPIEHTGTRRSSRRAAQLKRDRSADALLAASVMPGTMLGEPKLAAGDDDDDDDDAFEPKRNTRQASSASSAAAAAAAAEQADDDELDPSALMTAASAQAFNPGQQHAGASGGAGMARLPSIASGVIDRLTSREFDGLDVLSTAASSQSKRTRPE